MSDASIALNRFGLGVRAGEPPVTDPKRWLTGQFDRYDARPAPIAGLPSTSVIAGNLADYLADVREQQRERRQSGDMPQRPGQQRRRAAGYTPPAASGTDPAMTMQDGTEPGAPMRRRNAPMQDMPMAEGQDMPRDPVQQARQFARRQGRDYYAGAVTARCLASLDTPAPFVERMVHFWANHFAVSADKLTVVGLSGQLEFDAVRPHVLGKFRDMLFAVERHPAMLLYLDQAQSVGPNSVAGQVAQRRQARQQPGLNENLAREIMELHTLGVRTVYTQADVTEFARAMTGWTVSGLGRGAGARFAGVDGNPGDFVFADRIHEPGARTILGKQWPQQGYAQASAVLDMLATHPATAKHIATKLARHFAGDDPPPALVAKLERSFLATGGDLPSLYRALIDAPEAWAPKPAKFRTPWDWTIASYRALGTRELQPLAAQNLLRQLGQPVWQPGSPAGWDDVAASWAGPDAIMRRVEAAERMAQRTRDTLDARARAAELFPGALSPSTAQAIARAESPGQGVALMLVAPEFMRR
ncbi:DUF1800 domain-containing protein [Sphingomonas sp. G-3-2-10]|uniref:DUF1800 domain-containing protein n=1 Tax=Sphingomonas sp. G-3-2-10 TaxID=2728838 RepID=UPI00146DD70E|nr:DUF1800 domain-containing protein [Sphingomonas sp. G-3-2-10]NML05541.1 DUF1800 domain-containing protein [Sphingomonas sp. G-3-2-10]